MRDNEFSRTALLVCAYRARHTEAGLCDDPWAAALAGEDGGNEALREVAAKGTG